MTHRATRRALSYLITLTSMALVITACGQGGGGDGGSGGTGGDPSGTDGGMGGTGGGMGGAGGGNNGGMSTGEGPCEVASACAGDVCVALIDGDNPPVYCTEQCDGETCPDGFVCDTETFALVGLGFCRFGDPAVEPAPPSEPPRLPCREDADCDDGLVCAEFEGERDCTLPCTEEDECTPPALGGLTVDLATCGQDEGADRTVCLPDLDCFPDPIAAGCLGGLPF